LGERVWCPANPDFIASVFRQRYRPPTQEPVAVITEAIPVTEAVTEGIVEGADAAPAPVWGVLTPIIQSIKNATDTATDVFKSDVKKKQDIFNDGFNVEPVRAATIQPVAAQQTSLMPWVAGGLIALAAGAGLWALWPRKE
jgi:hypothetical protein